MKSTSKSAAWEILLARIQGKRGIAAEMPRNLSLSSDTLPVAVQLCIVFKGF
jgi:hypothetical protein